MDPASIAGLVAACFSLTKQCASVIKTLHALIETYKSAELTILSVVTECETIQFAWLRIELWAKEHLYHVDGFEELGARLQKSIYCGEIVMSAFEEELLSITSKSGSLGKGVNLAWNSSVLNEHQNRIRGQVAALQLLLQVMSLPRKEDRIEVLSVKEKVFFDSDESALSIVPSDRSTRFSLDGNRLSMISDDGDIQYIRFSFEDALFTSHVYKRNYRFPTKRATRRGIVLPGLYGEDFRASMSSEPDIKTLTDDINHEADEEFFQDQMVQMHHDLYAEDLPENNVDQLQSSVLELGTSTTSGSNTASAPLFLTTSSETDSKNYINTNAYSGTLPAAPSVDIAREEKTDLEKKREREAKTMLSRALQKANTGVLLDNAQNFQGAIEAYEDSCKLLQQVMIRSSLEEDRQKLDAIRVTYIRRIEEIRIMVTASE